jgi:Flp pilus assembly protein TadG
MLFASSKVRVRSTRKGAIAVLAAVLMIVMLAFVAFSVDLGYLCLARTQAQASADAAALAAAWELADQARLKVAADEGYSVARSKAIAFAAQNRVAAVNPWLDANASNHPSGDIVIGRLDNPSDLSEKLQFDRPESYNAVQVRVRRDAERNGAVPLFFARALGLRSADISAQATAVYANNVRGVRVTEDTGKSSLLPFAVHVNVWKDLLNGKTGADNWKYDPETKRVSGGSDGILEYRFKAATKKADTLTPGNFGVVNLGDPNNSASALWRQIRNGPTAEDLGFYGGELAFDPASGSLQLSGDDSTMSQLGGDTGVSASMSKALAEVLGQSRTILLYDNVAGTGNTTSFRIVGFAGARIVDYRMTGNNKYMYPLKR